MKSDHNPMEAMHAHSTVKLACLLATLILAHTVHGCATKKDSRQTIRLSSETSVPLSAVTSTQVNDLSEIEPTNKDLQGFTIVLDAGHGGKKPGAKRQSVAEKDINLSVTTKLQDRLEDLGATVFMTRESDVDVSLAQRAACSNRTNADIFVSIHSNAARHKSIDGIETYYWSGKSKLLAKTLFQSLVHKLKAKPNWVNKERLFVLSHNEEIASLVEIGYMSNPRKLALLSSESYQDQVAEALAEGIVDYFRLANPG